MSTQSKPAPPGFITHTESTTSILFAIPPPPPAYVAPTVDVTKEKPKKGRGSANATEKSIKPPVFLNPVQEYNRDLSIVAIRTWSEERANELREAWEMKREAKLKTLNRKGKNKRERTEEEETLVAVDHMGVNVEEQEGAEAEAVSKKLKREEDELPTIGEDSVVTLDSVPGMAESSERVKKEQSPVFDFTVLEALSATGLRAIRYAKEIPLLRYVIANDLVPSAVTHIRQNVAFNDLGPRATEEVDAMEAEMRLKGPLTKLERTELERAREGKVRVNEGDACQVMYNHRSRGAQFDVIDLDPYGSAVPFLDAAIGAVNDGGLLCVTCTDLGVLAGHNYPEKCFSHYGGVSVHAEYSHEVALRLVLHSIATTAARYGRHIVPLVSLSIDFYVRVCVRVYTGPKEVKALATNTSILFYCHDCQSPFLQPLGRISTKVSNKDEKIIHTNYHDATGPPAAVCADRDIPSGETSENGGGGGKCGECGGRFHIGGPLWSGPLHSTAFVEKMLAHVKESPGAYGTESRIEGMLNMAGSEIATPLYFTASKMAGMFHCTAPPINVIASALLNSSYTISRSHALPGSLKTNAPRSFVHDVMRKWILDHPVMEKNVKGGSPSYRLLHKVVDEARFASIDLTYNPAIEPFLLSKVKLVRYQQNPEPGWGPGKAAVGGGSGAGGKKAKGVKKVEEAEEE